MNTNWKNWVSTDLGLILTEAELERFEPILKKCHYALMKGNQVRFGDYRLLRGTGILALLKRYNLRRPAASRNIYIDGDLMFSSKNKHLIAELNEIIKRHYIQRNQQ